MISEMVDKIASSYKPQKIILFGSYAYGEPDQDSDIDLLIVKETDERPIDRRVNVRRIVSDRKRRIPFEPIVITQNELKERMRIGDQFIDEILTKGEALYEEGESLYPKDWFRIGAKELRRAENLLGLNDLEGAGFNIHQAVEKYLKGFLLSKGWKLRRVHDLETLLNEVLDHDASFEEFRQECLRITDYYVEERYPFTVVSELTEEEVSNSLKVAKRMIDKILY